jgi:hypothetical protein
MKEDGFTGVIVSITREDWQLQRAVIVSVPQTASEQHILHVIPGPSLLPKDPLSYRRSLLCPLVPTPFKLLFHWHLSARRVHSGTQSEWNTPIRI